MKTRYVLVSMVAASLIAGSANSAVVFSDDFSEASGTAIAGHVPDVGNVWAESTGTGLLISAMNSMDTSGAARDAEATFVSALGAGEILTLTFDARVPGHGGFGVLTLREAIDGTEEVVLGSLFNSSWGPDGSALDGNGGPTGDTTTAAAGVLTSFIFTYEFDTGDWTYTGLGGPVSGAGNASVALAAIDIRNGNGGDFEVDNIVVDISPVPEPGSLALLGLGGLALLRRRRD